MLRAAIILVALAAPAQADQSILHRWIYGETAEAAEAAEGVDSVGNAFAACGLIDGTGLTSAPCSVSGSAEVIATIDMTGAEAREACPQLVAAISAKGLEFGPGWKLLIRSPYSGESSIAFCSLT